MENRIEAVDWMHPGKGKIIVGSREHVAAPCLFKQCREFMYTNTTLVCLTEQIQQWPKLVYLVQPENQ